MLERFSIECCIIKTKVITKANRRKESALKSLWELKIKPTKLPKARENAGEQVVIGFNFESDWLREWREFLDQSWSEVQQIKAIPDYSRHSIENCLILWSDLDAWF